MAVGLLQRLQLQLVADQDLTLQQIPSPTTRDGLLVTVEKTLIATFTDACGDSQEASVVC